MYNITVLGLLERQSTDGSPDSDGGCGQDSREPNLGYTAACVLLLTLAAVKDGWMEELHRGLVDRRDAVLVHLQAGVDEVREDADHGAGPEGEALGTQYRLAEGADGVHLFGCETEEDVFRLKEKSDLPIGNDGFSGLWAVVPIREASPTSLSSPLNLCPLGIECCRLGTGQCGP